eukprot:4692194-Amphidinium_carterae.1
MVCVCDSSDNIQCVLDSLISVRPKGTGTPFGHTQGGPDDPVMYDSLSGMDVRNCSWANLLCLPSVGWDVPVEQPAHTCHTARREADKGMTI